MSPQTAIQTTSPTQSARAALTLVADNEAEQPEQGWRFKEARNSFAIANSSNPILFISEQSAASYGAMAKYILDAFPNTPIIFENDEANKTFISKSGAERRSVHNQTAGICAIDESFHATSAHELTASDCIIVMGTPKPSTANVLHTLGNNSSRTVITRPSIESADNYVPTAGVNIAQINAITAKKGVTRSPHWINKMRGMRPCIA